MIRELKLTALKSQLASVRVQAEHLGEGVLICTTIPEAPQLRNLSLEEFVAVKTGQGQAEIEGNVSEVYYIVRKEIYL